MFEKLDPKECQYLNYSDLPTLVLAVHDKYSFNDARKWKPIAHQTAGHACNQHYMMGTILQPRPEIAGRIHEINRHWLWSDVGALRVTLDDIIKYRNQLNGLLAVDCNYSYQDFEEGIYPIDCSPDVVRKLSLDYIPDNFDEAFIQWRSDFEKFAGSFNRWHLYILGDNCD